MKQALVLGGGGVVGIARETGVVAGLPDNGDVLAKVSGRWTTIEAVDTEFLSEIGRRFMDGGVRSSTSADLLVNDAPRHVVVIAPIVADTTGFGDLAERCWDAEIEQLCTAGSWQ